MEDKETLTQLPPTQGQLKRQFGPKWWNFKHLKIHKFQCIVMKNQIYKKPKKGKKKKRKHWKTHIERTRVRTKSEMMMIFGENVKNP